MAAEPHRERELAGLPVLEPEERIGVDGPDRDRVRGRDLLDLDAALGRAHQQDPPGPPVQHGRQVVLLDDVGGRRHEDLADRDALDRHAEDARPRPAPASSADAASLTPPALPRPPTRTWALMTTWSAPCAMSRWAAARASVGVRATSHGGHRQALGEEEGLGVGFLDLHAGRNS